MVKNTKIMAALAVMWMLIGLHGCGGAATDSASDNALNTALATLNSDQMPADASANAVLSFPDVIVGSDDYLSTSKDVYLGPLAFFANGNSSSGLTGKGVWIGIIDDFKTQEDAVFTFSLIGRKKVNTVTSTSTSSSTSSGSSSSTGSSKSSTSTVSSGSGANVKTTTTNISTTTTGSGADAVTTTKTTVITITNCAMIHQWSTNWTHGDLVAQIAGGTQARQSKSLALTVPETTANPDCAKTFYGDTRALEALLDIQPTTGVASAASIQRFPVQLGTTGDSKVQLGTILGHLQNALAGSMRVVNMSLGSDIGVSSDSRQAIVDAAVANYPINGTQDDGTVNAVITVAAGNSSASCRQDTLQGCNLVAVAMASQSSTKDSTIVVGALTGSGSAQKKADYSTFPGYLKGRFLWASGDSNTYPSKASGQRAQGTSFAAPRVAGAAALLREKCPTLTSVQIANLLLDSADLDMNNDGTPDFEPGVDKADPTWGRGKLSLGNALALAAKTYPTLCTGTTS